ncbi:iron uptake system protein EfeO [Nocardioides daejeonensis]|uniref:iron uptake system protein EfeO n=1 Tax=Nocardioides daejeonensis TaxID=1046556 RepID=UPI001EF5953A|nr:iron uptake system protein EfeO [Nocardioides daejeonensis]
MARRPLPARLLAPVLLVAVPTLAACTQNADPSDSGDPRALSVNSSADACELSATKAPAGKLSFTVANTGDKVTEFYLLAEDGLRILGEIENVGPGVDRTLTVSVPEGSYVTACKPGMTGDGIRGDFTVTASDEQAEVSADEQALVAAADANYRSYVQDQTDQLVARTDEFAQLYKAGKDDEARELYPRARLHWERIETVAEAFGELDPIMDAREADLSEGDEFTGWHRIEKDLWPQRAEDYTPMTPDERAAMVDQLVEKTHELDELVDDPATTYPLDKIANGSRGLLEEVATGKVTGEEEYWSHTDLWDFQGNVDGARVAFEGVRPVLEQKDPELAGELETRFGELQELLDQHKVGEDGFVLYTELNDEQVKALSDAVNALLNPLSKLTAAVLS